ncbi:VOC family protein [Flavivirga sp. 57AJ16]|uniref:VOC family protein n=1 Tax=Flavivirga sp. 57AJ16 TaxID=3025307 RepID=UPI002365CFCE|nr:VOC family protein [Flavivirga sp. 57AJ16]MDD7887988.1 VOC family protein [Flavivirga sp. 57AJ16]
MQTKIVIIAIWMVTAFNFQSFAQSLNVVGMDHIGVNVPNIDEALVFFEVLGFKKVSELDLIELDDNWKQRYKIRRDATIERIVTLRASNGSKIELFQYKSAESNEEMPFGDDLAWYHIAFYTDDIDKSVATLKSKGITFLDDPILNSSGETWAYFKAPWGLQLELISYPNEKGNPKEESLTLKKQTKMSKIEIEALAKKHLDIWTEKNAKKRNKYIKEVYTEGVEIVDPFFVINGHSKLNDFIEGLQKKHPGFDFSLAQPIESHNNIARLFWQFGTTSKPDEITGQDIFVIENGKIKSLYIFIDGLKN